MIFVNHRCWAAGVARRRVAALSISAAPIIRQLVDCSRRCGAEQRGELVSLQVRGDLRPNDFPPKRESHNAPLSGLRL